MALDIKNLSIRTVSGLVYAGLLVGAIILGTWTTAFLSAFFAVIASYEIESNTLRADNEKNWSTLWLLDAATLFCLILSGAFHQGYTHDFIFFWVALILLRFLVQVFLPQKNPLKSISVFCLEQFYLGLPLLLLVFAVANVFNPWIIVCAVAMIWINDTGAYLVGSLFGKHKMYPRLSPNKSWEGFLGGLLFNIGAAFIYYYCFKLNSILILSDVVGWIYIGICVTVFATAGDLFESMLKRSLGIKDFGKIIPGHGGILDRIDSLLFVVPFVLFAVVIASDWLI